MKKNLLWYRVFALLNDPGWSWGVYFLLMLKFISMQEILMLQGLQQISVVALEIPSGIISDRLGRKPTLILSALAGLLCFVCLIVADSLAWFALTNILWAFASSFVSGTDSSLHFDTLEAIGLEHEFQRRDANLKSVNLLLQATLAVAGGWLYAYNPRWPFVISSFFAGVALLATLLLKEPTVRHRSVEATLLRQVTDLMQYFKKPIFLWILGFAAFSTVLDYLPYQYYQPYLELVRNKFNFQTPTSIITGWHASLTMLIGAAAVGLAPRLLKRWSSTTVLLAGSWIHLLMILSMSVMVHPLIAVVLIFREIPNGLKAVVVPSLILPQVNQYHRATVLSLISFVARLAVGAAFLLLASVPGDGVFGQIAHQLQWAGAVCLVAWGSLLYSRF